MYIQCIHDGQNKLIERYHNHFVTNHKKLIKSHDIPTELWLHMPTEPAKYFRVTISLNLGVKVSNLIQV